jgi:hypothetical protein
MLNFYNLNNSITYQYLLKVVTKTKVLSSVINIDNYVG